MDDIMKSIHEHKLGVQNHIDNHNAELRGEDLTTLQKGKKMPIGTVSNGRKKVAEGKWVDVKDSKGKSDSFSSKYDSRSDEYIRGEIAHTERSAREFGRSGDEKRAKDREEHAKKLWGILAERKKVAEGKWTTVNESTGTSKLQDSERMNSVNSMWSKFDKEFKSKNLHSKTLNMPNEKVAKQFKEDFKSSKFKDKYTLSENPTDKLKISITKKYTDDKSSGPKGSHNVEVGVPVSDITSKYSHLKERLGNISGKVDIHVVDRDTSGMAGSQDKYKMEAWKDGKKVADLGSHPSKTGMKWKKSIEEDVDLQKGAMTAGNIYAKNPKHEVKKKIDKMFDPETEEDEDDIKKENCGKSGIKKGQLVIEEADRLSKGKKMPIGTVSNGRKKVAEGKWVDVKDSKGKSNKEASEKKEGSGEKKSSKMTSNIPDTISELTGGSAVDKVEVKNGKQMERIVDLDNKNTKPYYKVYDKKSKKVLASTNEYSDAYDVLNEKKSGGDKKFVSASDSIKSDMKGKSQQERVFAAVERIKKIAGKTGVGKVDKDSGMVKTFSRIYGIKEDKMLKLIQEHGKGTNSKPKSDTSDPSMSAEGKVMTVGAIKQFKEFQKEYNKVEDSKKKAYISDLKSKMERIVEAGAHQNSVYGADLFTAAQKLVKENGGGLVSSYKKKPKITDPRPDKNKSIEEDIDLTKAISDFDSLIKGGSDNRDKALMKKLGLEGYNKPKRTPNHPTKSHVVFAKEGNVTELIRFGEQGAKTAGSPKEGESAKMKKKRASFKARHGKNIARGKLSAAHWADKVKW